MSIINKRKTKKLRSDFLCVDILYLKNYILSLINEMNIEESKSDVYDLLNEANYIYKKYQNNDYIEIEIVLNDLNNIKNKITKLHIRKTKNKTMIEKYEDICFFITESKKLYNSDFAI